MNDFQVRHLRHSDGTYSMTLERAMGEGHRPMTDMAARAHSTVVTFYDLAPEEMLSLGDAICAEARTAKSKAKGGEG